LNTVHVRLLKPGPFDILQPHCADVSELLEQELEGFIDTSYVAAFRAVPAAAPHAD